MAWVFERMLLTLSVNVEEDGEEEEEKSWSIMMAKSSKVESSKRDERRAMGGEVMRSPTPLEMRERRMEVRVLGFISLRRLLRRFPSRDESSCSTKSLIPTMLPCDIDLRSIGLDFRRLIECLNFGSSTGEPSLLSGEDERDEDPDDESTGD